MTLELGLYTFVENTPSGGVQIPQLSLQQTCPRGQVTAPHSTGPRRGLQTP